MRGDFGACADEKAYLPYLLCIACPGRNFAIAELCMLATRLIQTFDFSEPVITEKLAFDDGDFDVGPPAKLPNDRAAGTIEIIDLDDTVRTILHPGNASDRGESCALVARKGTEF